MSDTQSQPSAVLQWDPKISPSLELIRNVKPTGAQKQGYEDVPILKRPVWGWEIAWYFFVEGISAGMYTLGTIGDLVGTRRYRKTITIGRLMALLAMMPAPVLLIMDLGRPERFHHMLRVFKPKSPMNVGTWALTGYAFHTTMRALHSAEQYLPHIPGLKLLLKIFPEKGTSVAGLPFAFTMLSYPGVLLSSTSIPVWAHTHYLGATVASSSMSTGAATLALVSEITDDEGARNALHPIETLTEVAEVATMSAYLLSSGKAARPLTHGKQSKLFWIGAVGLGLVAPAILRRQKSKAARIAASLCTLAGGLAFKWALTHAGQESALDRESAIHNAEAAR